MKIFLFLIISAFSFINVGNAQNIKKYKCMIQMTNYMGEGAYIVASIIDSKGNYVQTLYVLGSDKKWYPDIKEWYKAFKKKPTDISAITGASISGGDRAVKIFEINEKYIDKDFELKFESAVENNVYKPEDVLIPLTSASLSAKTDGNGYIRYVRFIPN